MRTDRPSVPLLAVGMISAAALAYEVLLIRLFALVHWHHLVATAISLALLGYGASGTFIALARHWLQRHFAAAFVANALLFSLSSAGCVALAQRLPLDPQALTWEPAQLAYLVGTFLVLALPFFAAANCIALTMSAFTGAIPTIYGFDLVGAGLGAFLLLFGLAFAHPATLLLGVFCVGLAAMVVAAHRLRWRRLPLTLLALVLAVTGALWARPDITGAAYKDLTRALTASGAAVDAEITGVAGVVTVVRNDTVPLRSAPGLSLQATALPPRQLALFVDGDAAGALGRFDSTQESVAYLHQLTSALPYQLIDRPRVAVLNAGVGAGVQQALALGAASVAAVEPNPLLHDLRCGHYADSSGAICDPASVRWHIQSTRAPLRHHDGGLFDLVTLNTDTDIAGLDALDIDFDLTREALGDYLDLLRPGGWLAINGPTRVPPRLVLRLVETAAAALRQSGIDNPGSHIAAIRGWRHFALLVGTRPLDRATTARVRAFAEPRGFDLVWLPDIRPDEANRFQQLAAPLFYQGAARILATPSGRPAADGRFRLDPARDDRPFPHRFTRWSAWWAALISGQPSTLAQLDAALLVATATLASVALIGVTLIVVPLAWLPPHGKGNRDKMPRTRVLAYFGLLGIAFLFVEIAWIQRLQLYLGHPVYATTAVLAAFLIFAGLGSLWSQRHGSRRPQYTLVTAVIAIAVFVASYIALVPAWLSAESNLPLVARIVVVLLLLAPLAFAMGMPFPLGLHALGVRTPALVPWAWGINGCASVISAAGTPLLAAEFGFSGLILAAGIAYLCLPLIGLNRAPD